MEKLLIPLVSSLEFPTLWRVGNDGKLEFTDQVIVLPAKIAGLFIGFFVLRWFLHRAIHKIGRRTGNGNGHVAGLLAKSKRGSQFVESTLQNERRAQRAETVASLLCSVVTIVLSAVLVVMLLSVLGFNVLPLVASASIIGVVLGFGAQTLVKDFLAGIFMIFEDQYGVGDLVDMEKATGVVESVGLRITRLRGDDGTTWYVRNGEVLRVGNLSTRSPDQVAAAETNAEAAASARESAANAGPAPYEAPAEPH